MSESTLSLSYADLCREVVRLLDTGKSVYAQGTVGVSAGVVTLTGGAFPAWAGNVSVLSLGGTGYEVASRESATQLTLADTSVNVNSGARYVLLETDQYRFHQVEDAIATGLRQFHSPLALENEHGPHRWSFLMLTRTLALENGTAVYDLPADFGQVLEDVTYQAGNELLSLDVIRERDLRAMQSTAPEPGTPRYVAWRPKAVLDATAGQRFEALVYPTPDAARTLEYRYLVLPEKLTPENRFPLGGAQHADTILSSCLSVAEGHIGQRNQGVHAARFQQRLAASVQADRRSQRVESRPWLEAVPIGSYAWLQQEIGKALDFGPNPRTWTSEKQRTVHSVMQQGIRQFVLPQTTGQPGQRAHRWSFLRPLTTITTNAPYSEGTVAASAGVVTLTGGEWPAWAASGHLLIDGRALEVQSRDSATQLTLVDAGAEFDAETPYRLVQWVYDLPSDYGGLEGKLTYPPGAATFYLPIQIVPEHDLRSRYQTFTDTLWSRPLLAAERVKPHAAEAGTRWELAFWPYPDAAYTLTYRYRVNPNELADGEFPHGGVEHSQTLLLSCLAVADSRRRGEFLEQLAASIDADQMEHAPARLGMNYDRSEFPDTPVWDRMWDAHNLIEYDTTPLP